MNFLDKLQHAWQSQCSKPIDVKPDQLLKTVRLERRMVFMSEMVVMLILAFVGIGMLRSALRDIHRDWPWLIYSACLAWVVAFILFNQWRRRRHAPHYHEPLLAHVEWSIKDLEYRMRVDGNSRWWYVLPIALGCMIPPIIFGAMVYSK